MLTKDALSGWNCWQKEQLIFKILYLVINIVPSKKYFGKNKALIYKQWSESVTFIININTFSIIRKEEDVLIDCKIRCEGAPSSVWSNKASIQ